MWSVSFYIPFACEGPSRVHIRCMYVGVESAMCKSVSKLEPWWSRMHISERNDEICDIWTLALVTVYNIKYTE